MITIEEAGKKVLEEYPDFEIEHSYDYEKGYVFSLLPKGFDLEKELGFDDSFYIVDKTSGVVSEFAPWNDADFLSKFSSVGLDSIL